MGMFEFLATEDTEETAQNYQSHVVSEGQQIADENNWAEKYPQLVAGLESADPHEQYVNGYTAMLMRNQARFIERCVKSYGESTVRRAA